MSLKTKVKNLISEEFYKGVKIKAYGVGDDEYVEVFKNPNAYEVQEVLKSCNPGLKVVRIATDNKNNIYVWKGDIIHQMMVRELGFSFLHRMDWVPTDETAIQMSEGTRPGWKDTITYSIAKKLKVAFPKAKIIEPLMGDDKLEL